MDQNKIGEFIKNNYGSLTDEQKAQRTTIAGSLKTDVENLGGYAQSVGGQAKNLGTYAGSIGTSLQETQTDLQIVSGCLTQIQNLLTKTKISTAQLESALKKNASVIAQALDMYRAENGVSIVSNLHTHEFKPEIIKYFNILKDCGFGYNDDSACIKNYGSSNSDKNSNTYKNFSGTASIDLSWFDDGQFVLTDGSLILLENNNNLDGTPGNIYISVDVNGYKKRPNRLGQDLFMFQVNNEGKLLPMGVDGSNFYSANDTYCSKSSTHKDNGAGCTYKALSDSSFWKNLP